LLVLFFSALSFGGYLARRIVGVSRGYPLAGLLGGMVSSTSVTLSFARLSRQHAALGQPLARGVVAANTVIYLRVLAAASVLSPALATALAPYLIAPFAVGLIATVSRENRAASGDAALAPLENPLQLRSAIEMALLFQVVLVIVYVAERQFGSDGLLATAAVLGLNDADALTLSMAHSVDHSRVTAALAAKAVAVGLLSNTCVKGTLALVVGAGRFRHVTVAVLAMMAVALGVGVVLL
jgi:uncharacterized membrane protein (DUF4010 family)